MAFDENALNVERYALPIAKVLALCDALKPFVDSITKKIDLGDPLALKVYNECLFLLLEKLRVVLPHGHLIPTAGIRRAFVDFIYQRKKPKYLIEIGTGPVAILSLLFANRGVSMVATEVDSTSYDHAKATISENRTGSAIRLLKSSGGVFSWLPETDPSIFPVDGVVSFPPYYDEPAGLTDRNRGFLGTSSELYMGDTIFGSRLLREAREVYPKVKFVALLWKNRESVDKTLHSDNTIFVNVIAGTRKRIFTLTDLVNLS